jgi:glycosyltransferase involved in cell wall biosynthesis
MKAVHIGVNALYLLPGGVGGTEIYLRSLLQALAAIDQINLYTVFTNRETGPDLVPLQQNFRNAPQSVRAANRPARILWEQTILPFDAARRGVQVLFNPGFTAPFLNRCPNVTVFHDLQHKRHPEHFRWFDLPFWRAMLYGSVHRSRKLIAVSSATADDLVRFYGIPPDRIRVIAHGVDERFFAIAHERISVAPLILCVSTLHPHKNLDMLLRAFALFRAKNPDFRLTIAGMRGFYADELERLRSQLGLSDAVRITGWIPREDLYDLFRQASAFLYPSTFEGFGMPILEALAAGIPSACSNVEPMKSVAGQAALLFDPASADAICAAMESLIRDPDLRRRLTEAGPLHAAQFSWQTAARETLETLLTCASV